MQLPCLEARLAKQYVDDAVAAKIRELTDSSKATAHQEAIDALLVQP